MSSYHLNRFLFDLKMDGEAYERATGDLDRALRRYELSAEEAEAIKQGDPRKLRQLGAHGMLALYVLRLNPEFHRNIYWTQK
jgi:hypothetical protein